VFAETGEKLGKKSYPHHILAVFPSSPDLPCFNPQDDLVINLTFPGRVLIFAGFEATVAGCIQMI
jgi:hypothetical protein